MFEIKIKKDDEKTRIEVYINENFMSEAFEFDKSFDHMFNTYLGSAIRGMINDQNQAPGFRSEVVIKFKVEQDRSTFVC